MLDRGLVVGIVDPYHFKVRIPTLNKGPDAVGRTPDPELYTAVVSSIPGIAPKFKVGDIVIIGYENDDVSLPVIVGQLFNQKSSSTASDASFSSLKVTVNSLLPEDTTIGEVTPKNILSLKNLNQNIQEKFHSIDEEQKLTNVKMVNLFNSMQDIKVDLDVNSSEIIKISNEVEGYQLLVDNKIVEINDTVDSVEDKVDDLSKSIESSMSDLGGSILDVEKSVEELETSVGDLKNHDHDTRYSQLGHSHQQYSFNGHNHDGDYASKSHRHSTLTGLESMILTAHMYGTTLPTTHTAGQLFFKLEEG